MNNVRYNRRGFLAVCALAAFLSALCAPPANAQQGAITLPRNLADLSATADRIVQGKVVAARVEAHPAYPNLNTVLVTLAVDDVMKGAPAKTLTFRQFIWDLRDVSSAAGYRAGDEVLLFLNRPTPLGLTSPVGLQQGRFRVTKGRGGELVAMNGSGNAGLLSGAISSGALNTARLSADSRAAIQGHKQGVIPLSALKESVRVLLQGQAGAK